MSRLIFTDGAVRGLERCCSFLHEKNPRASIRAAAAISEAFESLETQPFIGRPLDDSPELRELVIKFGDSGYVALYRVDPDAVYVLAFRHQKEAGY